MFLFTVMETLAVNKFPDLCDELAVSFEPCYFASYVCETRLLCMCERFRNEI